MPTAGPAEDLLHAARRRFAEGLGIAFGFTGFINLLQLAVPLFMLQVYDRVLNSRNLDTLAMLSVVAVGALVVFGILDYIRARLYFVLGAGLARRLDMPTLEAAVAETLAGGAGRAGQAVRDLGDIRAFITGSAISVPLEAVWAPLFLVILFLLHPVYGGLALVSAAILIALGAAADVATRRPTAEASAAAADAYGEVAASVRSAEAIEAMGMLPALAARWRLAQARMLEGFDRGNNRGKALAAASKAARMGMQVAVLAAGAMLVIDREASPGTMVAASVIMARMLLPFEQLIDSWRQWVVAGAAWTRVRRLLASGGGRRAAMALPRPAGRLAVERLLYIPPGRDRAVLKNVTFALDPGDLLGVVGPSAAGKSTLARMLVGIAEPTGGGVFLDGHNVFLWDRADFGRHAGYLPQQVALLDGTIRENIARMAEGADPHAVVAAARLADVHEMIGRLPFGYDTRIGDGGYALSGGQRQRIGLARAVFGNPAFLVLDEPNASLDNEGEQALQRTLAALKAAGTTVVVVAHRPSAVAAADKLLVLKDGAVEQFGPRTDVIRTVTPAAPLPAPRKLARLALSKEAP